MRFIRKNGRIIPIKEKGDKERIIKGSIRGSVIGSLVGAGVSGGAGALFGASLRQAPKYTSAFMAIKAIPTGLKYGSVAGLTSGALLSIKKPSKKIPEKKYTTSEIEQEKTNKIIDFGKGIVSGALARHFIRNTNGRNAFVGYNIADTGLDIFTASRRWKNRKSIGDFVKKEATGWGVEIAGSAVGFAGSHALIGLAKRYKLAKMAKASAYATSKFGMGKKLIGASNIINTTYKVL